MQLTADWTASAFLQNPLPCRQGPCLSCWVVKHLITLVMSLAKRTKVLVQGKSKKLQIKSNIRSDYTSANLNLNLNLNYFQAAVWGLACGLLSDGV